MKIRDLGAGAFALAHVFALAGFLLLIVAPGRADPLSIPVETDIWTTSVFCHCDAGGGPGGGQANGNLVVGGWSDQYYSLLKFNLTGQPSQAQNATLRLYNGDANGGTPTAINAFTITSPWENYGTTYGTGADHQRLWWADRPSVAPLSPNPNPLPAPNQNSFYDINITGLYNAWQSGSVANHGIELQPVSTNNNFDMFKSSRDPNSALRPVLLVTPNVVLPQVGQVVYLDFGANADAKFNFDKNGAQLTYAKADAGLSGAQQAQVITGLNSIYSGYNVKFTTVKPISGQYQTVFIGGTILDINNNVSYWTNLGLDPSNVNGIAQSINWLDSNKSATANVFSGNAYFNDAFVGPLIANLAQVIAHETGHLLGLRHVQPSSELMWGTSSASAQGISSIPQPLEIFPFLTQNSAGDLTCALGGSCLNADLLTRVLAFDVSEFLSTLYNAKLVFLDSGDADSGLAVLSLGNLQAGANLNVFLPFISGEKFIFKASSLEGGLFDIFSDPTMFQDGIPSIFALYKLNEDQTLSIVGSASLSETPLPATLPLFAAGLGALGLLGWRRKRKARAAA